MNEVDEDIKALRIASDFLSLVPKRHRKYLHIRVLDDAFTGDGVEVIVAFNWCGVKDDSFTKVIKGVFRKSSFGNFCTYSNFGEIELLEKAIDKLKHSLEKLEKEFAENMLETEEYECTKEI